MSLGSQFTFLGLTPFATKASCPDEENCGDTYGKNPNKTESFCVDNPERVRQLLSNQELLKLFGDCRRYGNHRMLSRFCLSYPI